MKLENLKCKKSIEPIFVYLFIYLFIFLKNPYFWENDFCQNINPLMFFYPKVIHKRVLCESPKITCLEKIWLKFFQPIRLQYFFIISISGNNQVIS